MASVMIYKTEPFQVIIATDCHYVTIDVVEALVGAYGTGGAITGSMLAHMVPEVQSSLVHWVGF